jgi:hypothetical protein
MDHHRRLVSGTIVTVKGNFVIVTVKGNFVDEKISFYGVIYTEILFVVYTAFGPSADESLTVFERSMVSLFV